MVNNSLSADHARLALLVAMIVGLIAFSGCGGGNSADPPAAAPTNIQPTGVGFVTDQAADNVLEFRLDIVAATLRDSSGRSLSAVGLPRHLELRHLELAPAMLFEIAQSQANYTSLQLTLANIAVDIVNGGKVQTFTGNSSPALRAASLKVTLPINMRISPDSIPGLMIDFKLAQSLSVDSFGNYIFSPVVVAKPVADTDQGWDLGAVQGKIVAISNSPRSINIQLYDGGFTVNAAITNTTFFAPDLGDFSKLSIGQRVELSARFTNGTFTASFIDSAADPATTKQGIVVAPPVNNGPIMMLLQN